jgi:hypothetical protein
LQVSIMPQLESVLNSPSDKELETTIELIYLVEAALQVSNSAFECLVERARVFAAKSKQVIGGYFALES